jgi:uncharacterized protein (DUF433 family)
MSFWQVAYKYGWATKDQLKQAVEYELIKDTDYKTITGEDYSTTTTTA